MALGFHFFKTFGQSINKKYIKFHNSLEECPNNPGTCKEQIILKFKNTFKGFVV